MIDYGTESTPHHGTSHCHRYDRDLKQEKKNAIRKLTFVFFLCLMFVIGLAVGGFFSNSLAIASDAAHMLTDLLSFLLSIITLVLSFREPSTKLSYGWHRIETMGAFASILMIWVLTGFILYGAIMRFINQDFMIAELPMVITASVSVFMNIILGVVLHYSGHNHSHGLSSGHNHSHGLSSGHSHSQEVSQDCEKNSDKNRLLESIASQNLNVRAAFIHILGDILNSVGILTVALCIYFRPDWKIADPICTVFFSIIVLVTTMRILKDIVMILMEAVPENVSYEDVTKILSTVDGVKSVHNLRIWSLTKDVVALNVHIVKSLAINEKDLLSKAMTKLHTKFDLYACNIQIDTYLPEMEDCHSCKNLIKSD